jgi:hypothetical protein
MMVLTFRDITMLINAAVGDIAKGYTYITAEKNWLKKIIWKK